jgi:hypothetical protein
MEEVIYMWNEMDIISKISKNKLIFFETSDYFETSLGFLIFILGFLKN